MPVTRCTDTLPGHTEAVLHVSFSPNGKILGSGGGDCVVRFWDVYTSTPLFECKGHKNHVLSTVWAPSGHYFISGDRNGVIIVWNPKTGKKKNPPLVGHKGYITYLCFEPLHLNKKCNRFASSSKDATVIIWNISTMSKDFLISGHSSSIECVKWGGEGLIYTASRDRIIRVWSAEEKGKLVRTLVGHAHRINSLALNTDYILKRGGYTHEDKEYKNNNINNNTIDEEMYNDSVKLYTEFMKGKNELLVSCSDDFTLYLWKGTIDKQPICRMTGHQQLVNHISFSPDGRYIASGSFDKKIKIWDGITGKFINTLTGHVGAVYQVCWSADSRILASASKDSTVKLWKPSNTHAVCTLPGHADEVYTLDWSGDGERVASGSKDRTIKMYILLYYFVIKIDGDISFNFELNFSN